MESMFSFRMTVKQLEALTIVPALCGHCMKFFEAAGAVIMGDLYTSFTLREARRGDQRNRLPR